MLKRKTTTMKKIAVEVARWSSRSGWRWAIGWLSGWTATSPLGSYCEGSTAIAKKSRRSSISYGLGIA